jgi:hypothetical protein
MIETQQDSATAQGEVVLAEAVAAYRQILGPRLLAAYALGSLAHGGFSPLVSDVDLGLIIDHPLAPTDPGTIEAVADVVRAGSSPLHERLSVFWGTEQTAGGQAPGGGRFPPLDRLDLLEHGRLVYGTDIRGRLVGPERDELVVAGARFALEYLGGDDTLEEIRRPPLLLARGVRRLTKLALFPVRFLFTAATGKVGTNHAAATHYLASMEAPGTELVRAALAWRTSPPDDDRAAADVIGQGMVPLYRHYIEDHATRLAVLGEGDLSLAFRRWRDRLPA